MSQLELTPQPTEPRVFTVAQVVRAANRALEQKFTGVCVEGEVSSYKLASSGHAFFSLIDDQAVLPVTMWRSSVQRLRFRLESGQRIRVVGRLGIYDKQGRFQMYADRAEPAGLGAQMLQLQQLRVTLENEGLLDPGRNRPLPRAPRVIGVITSPRGAAVHDILEVARRRCPSRILIAPAMVQGAGAARTLIRALQRIQTIESVDVIIIGRGGGSVEDLWAFNDEGLARAIADCPVPVVSAVGHEVDITAADWVSDLRAATPSHAAELVVPDADAWASALRAGRARLHRAVRRRLADEAHRLHAATGRIAAAGTRLATEPRARLVRLNQRLAAAHPRARLVRDRRRLEKLMAAVVTAGRALPRPSRLRLARASGALQALSPLSVLERGYAVVADDTRVITDVNDLAVGQRVTARFRHGRAELEVRSTDSDEPEA